MEGRARSNMSEKFLYASTAVHYRGNLSLKKMYYLKGQRMEREMRGGGD